jgi:hypothetical protein
MTTHETEEVAMIRSLRAIDGLQSTVEPARMIRIEPL